MKLGWSRIDLGGTPQWISLRGQDPAAPVLLWLHGGPGTSEFGARRKYLGALEERWLVVDWEQRGAGRSFHAEYGRAPLTLDRLLDDGIELVELLCRELARERVTLVGHSFGSVLGVLLAQRIPARIGAYVGTGQVVHWAVQESRSYEWTLAEARRQGKKRAIAALERIGPPVDGSYRMGSRGVEIERRWLQSLGGVGGAQSFFWQWLLSMMTCPDYPIRDKVRFLRAARYSMNSLWPELGRRIDFLRDVKKLDVPVHLFAGRDDRITGLDLVQSWYAALAAPAKRLEVVDGGGHLAAFEAPDRFMRFLDPVRAAFRAAPKSAASPSLSY